MQIPEGLCNKRLPNSCLSAGPGERIVGRTAVCGG